MKFPKKNPFAVPPACWQLRITVPMEAALAVEESFADDALSVASFESPEDPSQWNVMIITAEKPALKQVQDRLDNVAHALDMVLPEPDIEEVPQQDWLAAVARDFPPQLIGPFYVYGSHVKAPAPLGALPIQVEAGTAFGSGEHATTRGCLLALDRLSKARNVTRVLDMGCGSGILAIAAARLWPTAEVLAVDSDAVSVRVAQDNFKVNRVSNHVHGLVSNGYASASVKKSGPYELILANILARPLVSLSRALAAHLERGGVAVLSGLLDSQAAMVIAAHRRQGLRLAGRIRQNGWSTLVMESA